MAASSPALEAALQAQVRALPWLMRALREARALGLASWCIGAGALRNPVWDALHGRDPVATRCDDIDLVFFDRTDASPARDAALQARLQQRTADLPALRWEVVNQAAVHRWPGADAAAPFVDLADALAAWPETATAVGIRLEADDRLHVVAPYGLADLFDGVLRPSPACRDPQAFARRCAAKRWRERWPRLTVPDTGAPS